MLCRAWSALGECLGRDVVLVPGTGASVGRVSGGGVLVVTLIVVLKLVSVLALLRRWWWLQY